MDNHIFEFYALLPDPALNSSIVKYYHFYKFKRPDWLILRTCLLAENQYLRKLASSRKKQHLYENFHTIPLVFEILTWRLALKFLARYMTASHDKAHIPMTVFMYLRCISTQVILLRFSELFIGCLHPMSRQCRWYKLFHVTTFTNFFTNRSWWELQQLCVWCN